MRELIAQVRQPLRRGATLALGGAVLGAVLSLLPLVLPVESGSSVLRGLTWLPGIAEGTDVQQGVASATATVGFDERVLGASWPLPGLPGPSVVSVRPVLVAAVALWGLVLGALAGLFWQSNAARRSVGGGFLAGVAAGLVVALLLPVLPPSAAAEVLARHAALPGLELVVGDNMFAGRAFAQRVELRSGRPILAAVALGERETAATVEAQGQLALALVGGLAGVGVGLLIAGLWRRSRSVAVLPLGLGGGLVTWLALAFAPGAVQRAAVAALAALPGLTGSEEAVTLGPLVLARMDTPLLGGATLPVVTGVTLAFLALLIALAALLGVPVVAASAALATGRARRSARERDASEAARRSPTEPLPYDGGDSAEPPGPV